MDVMSHITGQPVRSVLDVGCNVGALLCHLKSFFPDACLAGVEINERALSVAKQRIPSADLRLSGAECLPFQDNSFCFVTCVEVLEQYPQAG